MTRRRALATATALIAVVSFASGGLPGIGRAHEDHGHFSAGEPGDPKKPARVVKVKMFEDGKKMLYEPSLIEVRRGEQVRFVLENSGDEDHEHDTQRGQCPCDRQDRLRSVFPRRPLLVGMHRLTPLLSCEAAPRVGDCQDGPSCDRRFPYCTRTQ